MMKLLMGYWVIGCLFVGIAVGAHAERCPDSPELPVLEDLAFAAMWPLIFTALWFDYGPLSPCEVNP